MTEATVILKTKITILKLKMIILKTRETMATNTRITEIRINSIQMIISNLLARINKWTPLLKCLIINLKILKI
jgi:hypothetical protein